MMKRKSVSIFCIGALLSSMVSGVAFAADDNDIINGQLNLSQISAGMDMIVYDADGYVSGTSAAIGNSFSGELGGFSHVVNNQRTVGAIDAKLDFTGGNIEGMTLISAAVGNTASIVSDARIPSPDNKVVECPEKFYGIDVHNRQVVEVDPTATLYFNVSGVGYTDGIAAAIGNSLSIEGYGHTNLVDTTQIVRDRVSSYVGATVSGAAGVSATSAAVGNTVSIDNLINN